MSIVVKEYVYPSSLKRIEPQSGQESVWENRLIPRSWPVKLFGFLINRGIKSYRTKSRVFVKAAPNSQ